MTRPVPNVSDLQQRVLGKHVLNTELPAIDYGHRSVDIRARDGDRLLRICRASDHRPRSERGKGRRATEACGGLTQAGTIAISVGDRGCGLERRISPHLSL